MHYLWRPLKILDGPKISLMLVGRENYSLFNSSLSFLSKSGWIEIWPKYSDQPQRTATRLRVGESSTFVSAILEFHQFNSYQLHHLVVVLLMACRLLHCHHDYLWNIDNRQSRKNSDPTKRALIYQRLLTIWIA